MKTLLLTKPMSKKTDLMKMHLKSIKLDAIELKELLGINNRYG